MSSAEVDSFLVYADIGGYTRFVKENRYALAHAQHAVSQLLRSVLDATEATLDLAKVEGDAVFLYAADEKDRPGGGPLPRAVSDALFRMFRAFYAARAQLQADNLCPCEGCRRLDGLDLKVIGHRGRVLVYRLNDQDELAGLDVIILHRLSKNHVKESRYLLLTESAYATLPIPADVTVERHLETYDDVGDIETRVLYVSSAAGERPKASGWRKLRDLATKMSIWGRTAAKRTTSAQASR